MSRRYDTRTTIFSPEGRLFQVEYAMEAIRHAPTCLGIYARDGVVLMAEKANTDKLLDSDVFSDKIYKLDRNIVCGVAGITSDANVLTDQLRLTAQRHFLLYQEAIPVEQLVNSLCNLKQRYTQVGGYRPFGVSLLYAGYDKREGFQLFQSDPSGNYGVWKATCIGKNSNAAIAMLKQEYPEELINEQSGEVFTVEHALMLGLKVLNKTLDVQKVTKEKVEVCTVARQADITIINKMDENDIDNLLERYEEFKEEEAKKSTRVGARRLPRDE